MDWPVNLASVSQRLYLMGFRFRLGCREYGCIEVRIIALAHRSMTYA
jgi:hypothetical protein